MIKFEKTTIALSIAGALALGQSLPAMAGTLDEIIVTGKPGSGVSKFESTVSINTLSSDEVAKLAPRSAAEVLRAIPGVRSESSAGEGNTNIAVRGVPIAAGGSKFVQLQEDGMPILQFGDIIVGTADQFLRIDDSLQRVEVLKGSSAATLASNAPAGVINFISKTGEEEGGSVTVSTGLDYDLFKASFDYGGALNEDWRFHVGGFYREGEGAREVGFNASKGGQIKANLTREFENGYFRLYAKYLNDSVPTYLPMPMTASQDSIRGFDAGSASNISNDLRDVLSVGATGGGRRSGIDNGNHSESTSIGAEFVMDLSDGLTLTEKFRYSQNSGTFFGAFTADIGSASNVAGISAAALGGTGANGLAYVSGANAGVELTASELANLNGNGLIQNIRTFDNDLESLDNFTNDLQLTKTFDDMSVTVGFYKATQEIDVNWYWQTFVQDVSNKARLMNVFADGVQLTENGQLAYGAPDWGGCCTRDTALEADLNALYVALNANLSDNLTIDASIRYDDGEATGHYSGGTTVAADLNNDGTSVGQLAETYVTFLNSAGTTGSAFEYDWGYMSYSLAANYKMSDELALFGSISQGSRVNADRLGDGGYYVNGTAKEGSVENELSSFELGAKLDRDNYSLFTTLFYVETDDVNSEVTGGGAARVRGYESLGLEVEGNAQFGAINVRGSMTWTDAEIVSSNNADLIGNTPRRQADFVWSLSPSYQFGDHYVGATLIGTGDSYSQDDNAFVMDGYTYINLFGDFKLAEGLQLQVSVNNVTDEIGMTEMEGSSASTIDGAGYIRARSIAGRTAELALKYSF